MCASMPPQNKPRFYLQAHMRSERSVCHWRARAIAAAKGAWRWRPSLLVFQLTQEIGFLCSRFLCSSMHRYVDAIQHVENAQHLDHMTQTIGVAAECN